MEVRLDAPLPAAFAVGRGTALFVCGTCFAAGAPIAGVSLLVDGAEQPVMAHGMPRVDLLRRHRRVDTSYRSGFWGSARLAPRPGARSRTSSACGHDWRTAVSGGASLAEPAVAEAGRRRRAV